ncbi:putative NAD(P)H-dependent oxidoreductase [Saccharolobus shibatae B12]|uniref:NADH:ubiquinone reductase (non-electrogenic) n=1 Tax=Saccharolobus shibatae (strain ATCC 51178 / DSM 5389 / JCM 8931 / NBRC 15437 / B12) TaxID=523848 RepID=A0A8F5BLT8_SACSH|nr:FAD-dependent oxidoreductase [Saccharolobus shibatae]QXJ27476.1 putative NAD(P)H-dependent oxidoreductase [Saccharolobus shibatae B12]
MQDERVVILGGGFAGIAAKLVYPNAILVDERDFMVVTPRLVEVIEKNLPLSYALIHRKVDVKAKVLKVDFKEKKVITTEGEIKFDKLIIALGYEQDLSRIKGAENYGKGFTLENVEKIKSFKEGSIVTILGGGALGVELAGALRKRGHIVNLLEAENRLVPYLTPDFSKEVQKVLERQGVNVILRAKVEEVKENEVVTTQGRIRSDYVIFSAGFSGPKIVREMGLSNKNNRMLVDKFLRSVDYDFVYGAGDCANFRDGFIPQSAQVSLQAGEVAMNNAIKGEKVEFKPVQKAIVFKIGDDYIGLVKNTVISGPIAALIKSFAISSLEGKVKKVNKFVLAI